MDGSAPVAGDATATSGIAYFYEQAKLQAAGRGLLGFKALGTVDLQRGVRTTTTYRQDFPYIGYPVTTEVVDEDGHRLRHAANTWQLQVSMPIENSPKVPTENSPPLCISDNSLIAPCG